MVCYCEYPIEIWVHVLSFASEADRRKVSVTCSFFANIFKSFFIKVWKFENEKYYYDNQEYLPIFLEKSDTGYIKLASRMFKILGPNPHAVAIELFPFVSNEYVSNSEFVIKFDESQKLPHHLDFNINYLTPPLIFTIVKLVDCQLKFTRQHGNYYYVDGCTFEDIHKPKSYCVACNHPGKIVYLIGKRQPGIYQPKPTLSSELIYDSSKPKAKKLKQPKQHKKLYLPKNFNFAKPSHYSKNCR